MKVIHITHGKANPSSANGISRVVYNLNKYEKLAGIDSQIWAIVDGCKKHETVVRDEFVTVECYPRVNFMGNRDIIKELEKNKDNIDIVHFHLIWFYDKNIIMKALNRFGIRTVITTHGTYSKPHAYTGKRKIVRWLFELDYLKRATECHILTPEEGTGLRKYGYTGKSFVGYNGVGRDEIPTHMSKTYYSQESYSEKIKICTVSVLRQDKNTDMIIRAIALLPLELRNKVVFVCIGPDWKGNAAKYKALAKDLDVEENFQWLGPKYNQEKYDALNSCDGYIMASDSEGFSMAILDAMACSMPMILTSGCNMKYVGKQDYYLMCEPYVQSLSRAIEKFVSMPSEDRIKMGQNAKRVLDKMLYWDTIVEGIINDYKRIITSK